MASPSMASSGRFVPILCLLLLTVATTAAAGARPTAAAPASGLAERLDGEGSQQCWEALMEIKSCTGEIILFYLNGEAYLGPGCCRAIRVIEQRCWAADAMLSVIGFTPEEGDMLKGYCDAGDEQSPSAPPPRRALDGGARESAAAVVGRKGLVRN